MGCVFFSVCAETKGSDHQIQIIEFKDKDRAPDKDPQKHSKNHMLSAFEKTEEKCGPGDPLSMVCRQVSQRTKSQLSAWSQNFVPPFSGLNTISATESMKK